MGEKECGASPGRSRLREGGRAWLGSCHGVASGMPGTQHSAWVPEEDDRREEVGWASPRAPGKGSASVFPFFFSIFF